MTANKSIDKVNGMLLNGEKVYVGSMIVIHMLKGFLRIRKINVVICA